MGDDGIDEDELRRQLLEGIETAAVELAVNEERLAELQALLAENLDDTTRPQFEEALVWIFAFMEGDAGLGEVAADVEGVTPDLVSEVLRDVVMALRTTSSAEWAESAKAAIAAVEAGDIPADDDARIALAGLVLGALIMSAIQVTSKMSLEEAQAFWFELTAESVFVWALAALERHRRG